MHDRKLRDNYFNFMFGLKPTEFCDFIRRGCHPEFIEGNAPPNYYVKNWALAQTWLFCYVYLEYIDINNYFMNI